MCVTEVTEVTAVALGLAGWLVGWVHGMAWQGARMRGLHDVDRRRIGDRRGFEWPRGEGESVGVGVQGTEVAMGACTGCTPYIQYVCRWGRVDKCVLLR